MPRSLLAETVCERARSVPGLSRIPSGILIADVVWRSGSISILLEPSCFGKQRRAMGNSTRRGCVQAAVHDVVWKCTFP